MEKENKKEPKQLTFEEIQTKIQKYAAKIQFKKQTYQKVKNEIEYYNSNFLRTKFFFKKKFPVQKIIRSNELTIKANIEVLEGKLEKLDAQIKIKHRKFIILIVIFLFFKKEKRISFNKRKSLKSY